MMTGLGVAFGAELPARAGAVVITSAVTAATPAAMMVVRTFEPLNHFIGHFLSPLTKKWTVGEDKHGVSGPNWGRLVQISSRWHDGLGGGQTGDQDVWRCNRHGRRRACGYRRDLPSSGQLLRCRADRLARRLLSVARRSGCPRDHPAIRRQALLRGRGLHWQVGRWPDWLRRRRGRALRAGDASLRDAAPGGSRRPGCR